MGVLDEIMKDGPNGSKPRAELPNAEDESGLPDSNDFKAYTTNLPAKPVYSLNCRLGKDGYRSFQYVQLDSNSSFRAEKEGHILLLRFAGTKIWEVTISGLNLLRLYDYIMQHRMPWITRDDRGFEAAGKDKEPLIRGIDIKEILREEG